MATVDNPDEKRPGKKPEREELATDQQIRRRMLKAFGWFGLASLVPYGVWKWIRSQPKEAGLPKVFRKVLNTNEQLANGYFSNAHLAPTFPKEMAAKNVRVNGKDGLRSALDKDVWRLQVERPGQQPLSISLDELKALPKQEIIFQFKCIEGWSQIQHWGGVNFAEFVKKYQLGKKDGSEEWYSYVGMKTPDGGYYVGIDTPSALHPQTILAYEMNDEPLTDLHGAPLRLIIPVKYGVKNLKRIGSIWFSDERPRDFWAERGYDYHVGL
ncbi:molybdopterin-dependent oxidoreductase-like protein [Larkinella arboricola]|uniref:Molybdopterin-dependent oxidoreductase-like protein n=1 Tax=Larkinella arboricola TaxID=643671 RepID=A0A327X8G3_LARAB|nr:molybdopterin-dependent oxidoreductase [Larkinella arboricola]RAK02508.1 molybdopterin-dependent oxidoreductase-like protein [Larkinella arboricola]